MMIAIMSLGYIAFPLSPRNNPTVTAYLLDKIGVVQLFVSEDAAMQSLANEANKLSVEKGLLAVELIPMVKSMELHSKEPVNILDTGIRDIKDNDVTVIMHSSGVFVAPDMFFHCQLSVFDRNHCTPQTNTCNKARAS